MVKYSQKRLLQEGFTDIVRGVASVAKTGMQTLAPEITQSLGKVAEPFKQMAQAFSGQQPVQFLKNQLKDNPHIEITKILKQEKKKAKKGVFAKEVTLITFQANVYERGNLAKGRQYKAYESYSLYTGTIINEAVLPPGTTSVRTLPGGTTSTTPPASAAPTSSTPRTPANATTPQTKTLTAEIFRTSKGLQLGDIFDTETGQRYNIGQDKNRLGTFEDKISNRNLGANPTVERMAKAIKQAFNNSQQKTMRDSHSVTDMLQLVMKLTSKTNSTDTLSNTDIATISQAFRDEMITESSQLKTLFQLKALAHHLQSINENSLSKY
jgi:hypothetical protein